MDESKFDTPVALFIYNRPEKSKQVVEQIATIKPTTMLVVADGPRKNHPRDHEKCRQTRMIVRDNIAWDCDVQWKVADNNLGLKKRFATGLEWIFEKTSEAIILEDDCLPNESFFKFCENMLKKYRDDERVMDISGTNHLGKWKSDRQDYHFSLYGGVWGWATWRSSWEWYDPDMELWANEEIRQRIRDVICKTKQADYVEYIFNQTYSGNIDTWDYQWGFARYVNSAVSVVPSKNLVSNIGFGDGATNTKAEESYLANLPRFELDFPITNRNCVAVDREYDSKYHKKRPISMRNKLLRTGLKLYGQFLTGNDS